VTGTGPDTRPYDRRDPWLRTYDNAATMLMPAGQPGHGGTAYVRRQPVHILAGRFDGGYTDVFEVICCDCGDHPYLDYREVSPGLQRIRGPYPMEAGLTAYEKHIRLHHPPAGATRPATRPMRTDPG
jgi:hypothetical protein